MSRTSFQILSFFDVIADTYENRIVEPAFRHFAAAVLQTAQPQGHEMALDVGTGTGILARLLAPQVRQVVGIDFAPQMIEVAQNLGGDIPNLTFEVGDIHATRFPAAHFDLIVASFGLNATAPRRVLPELLRLLTPKGVLAFHEWSLQHPLDSLLIDTLARFMVEEDDAPESLLSIREFMQTTRPWDHVFQTVEDYQEELSAAGFESVQVWEDAPVDCLLTVADFLHYKLAWANRRAELAAMDEWRRADCLDALRASLADETDSNGYLHYNPTLFRVRAVKQ